MFSLGFSPCPNDTFMFHALVNGKIDIGGLNLEVIIEDVETLNQRALRGELDITKVSFATFVRITDKYELLNAGSALGRGVGPLVISRNAIDVNLFRKNKSQRIAIPGKNTTANFLFSLFFAELTNRREMIFSEVEDAVLNGNADAGVIIHENRFTYEKKGLKKVCDLGELWEQETGLPIPLGGIAIKKSLPGEVKQRINKATRESIEYAFENPYASQDYVKHHAQEMEPDVIRKHIETYVNKYSLDLGTDGRKAIEVLMQKASQLANDTNRQAALIPPSGFGGAL